MSFDSSDIIITLGPASRGFSTGAAGAIASVTKQPRGRWTPRVGGLSLSIRGVCAR